VVSQPAAPALEPARIAQLLAATARTVEAELRALGTAGARWRPAAGEWCANEVVGHLVEADLRGFTGRIRTLLTEGDPAFLGWDQPSVAAERGDCAKSPDELLAEFLPLRAEGIELVRRLTPEDLRRAGQHNVVGRLTAAEIVTEWVHHDRNHVRQLLAIGQAMAWPRMGNARRFSDPDDRRRS
jgi:hypothetical protein